MTRAEIIAQVRPIIAEHLCVETDHVREAADFESMGADSLDMIEINIAVEETFEVEIPDDQIGELTTLGKIADAVLERLPTAAVWPSGADAPDMSGEDITRRDRFEVEP